MDNQLSGLMSHVAMSVSPDTFNDSYIDDLGFYKKLLGWQVDPNLSNEARILLNLPYHGQYINLKKREEPMTTTDYEHFGVYVDSPEQVRELYELVRQQQVKDNRVELDHRGVMTLYGNSLTTFRFKYLLPMAIEVQHINTGSD